MALIHAVYGAAAAAIVAEAGPRHSTVNPETTEEYDAAVECNSAAKSSQAAAATSIGPDPGPVYTRAELISGGNIPKSIVKTTPPYLCRGVTGLRRVGNHHRLGRPSR